MILRARPQMFAQQLAGMLHTEIAKGCEPDISPHPVPIEPPYSPLEAIGRSAAGTQPSQPANPVWDAERSMRLRIWISPEEPFNWDRSELWLKQMASLPHRVVFQITGNGSQESKQIELSLVCHVNDAPTVVTAFESHFGMCEVTLAQTDPLDSLDDQAWRFLAFREFFPPPPYSHNLTTHDELHVSPLGSFLTAMRNVTPPTLAFYQCIFQPVHPEHNWHENVALLLDIEYVVKLHNSPSGAARMMQQTPSGDLRQMASDVKSKAHNDKPFFAATVRVGLVGEESQLHAWLPVLSSAMNVFQHGGRPLRFVSDRDYERRITRGQIKEMILTGASHRPGFLINSRELAGFVHIFPTSIARPRDIPVEVLPSLPMRHDRLAQGTVIGVCRYAGKDLPVCVPDNIRRLSTHSVASHGMGKSVLGANMFLQDIERHGSMYIDAHGDTIKEILQRIRQPLWHRTVYFNPGDSEYVPLWNPMRLPPGGDISRLAGDVVSIIRRVSKDWGDRLDYLIRFGAIGLQHLPNTCVMDLYNLVRHRSAESKQFSKQVLGAVKDEAVSHFFARDFDHDYSKGEVQAPKHKLAKLLAGGTVSLMLSQVESLIDFYLAMEEKQILLVDLSDLDADMIELLGPLILLSAFMAARGRSKTAASQRVPFSVFVDEAHLYVASDAIEKLTSEARKFGIHLYLAHQYLKQFSAGKVDALGTVGTTIIGRVDESDSHVLARTLQGLVKADDLMTLSPYEMVARIGADVARIRTLDLPEALHDGREIVAESRRRYCRRAAEVRHSIAQRHTRLAEPFAPLDPGGVEFTKKDLHFDEW